MVIDPVLFKIFTEEEVKEINKEIKKCIVENNPAFLEKEPPSVAAHESKIGEFSILQVHPLMELLHPWLYKCQYINKRVYGYDIYWDFHLEQCNYNVYGTGGEYGWHIDANKDTAFDAKLTCILNLSEEPYEGGEFHIVSSGKKFEFTPGMGIILTSLLSHKVTPITKGERRTLTYWGEGPLWR